MYFKVNCMDFLYVKFVQNDSRGNGRGKGKDDFKYRIVGNVDVEYLKQFDKMLDY